MYSKIIGVLIFLTINSFVSAEEKIDFSDSESLSFIKIESQCYKKGQLEAEKNWLISETSDDYYSQKFATESYHDACVDSFKIAKHEVTLGLYLQYAAESTDITVGDSGCYVVDENGWKNDPNADWKNPSFQQETNHPVVCISYYETQKFIDWLNNKLKPGFPYRLPTEVEWELAARGSETQRTLWRYWGNDKAGTEACRYGNVSDLTLNDHKKQDSTFNCRDGAIHTSSVYSYEPNDYQLHNMLGNVQEFTCSGYSDDALQTESTCETQEKTENITVKGAAWYYPPMYNRAAFRGALPRHLRFYGVGFRLAQDSK
jgi:formylglycine-generating enzyme required for sulfatase activity